MAEIKIPNNSFSSKSSLDSTTQGKKSEEKKFSKVTTGKVTVKKKSNAKKLADVFILGDMEQVKQSLINDLLIPGTKNLLYNIANTALSMLFFNNQRPMNGYWQPNQYQQPPRPYQTTSYSSFYTQNQYQQQAPVQSGYSQNQEIVFGSRVDAENVLDQMNGALATYGQVSVADFYDLMGITTSYVDYSYGWYNLSGAHVRAVNGGFVIDFPRAAALRK